MSGPRHFLDIDELDTAELRRILELGKAFKHGRHPEGNPQPMAGRTLALIFEKPSTRTRVSFEVGFLQMGGHVVVLGGSDTQLGRGETVADTAQVLSRYVDAIMIRTDAAAKLHELAAHATVPVINGLTDDTHPCQLMADVMTYEEHRGSLDGRVVAWCGDGNNMARTWIQAASHFGFHLRLACPTALQPPAELVERTRAAGGSLELVDTAEAAVAGADLVLTDTWVSMGHKDAEARRQLLAPYQVNEALMAKAKPDALFMHCLPAHRGEEVTDAVIDGPQSAVWDEAENRMHVQKGVLAWCLL